MAINKLTAKTCETKEIGYHHDGGGLALFVKAPDKKYWRMQTSLNKKAILLSFGTYPEVSLAKAREERAEAKKLIKQGIHPAEHKKALKAKESMQQQQKRIDEEKTFKRIAERLLHTKKGKVTDAHIALMYRQMEIHLFPAIGDKSLNEITGKELLELFYQIAQKTSNTGKKTTYMAKRLCEWASQVYNFAAIEDDAAPRNPCPNILVHLPEHKTKNMDRIAFSELSKFIKKLDSYGGQKVTKAAIWMILYTGVRQASIRNAQWKDFDLEKNIWYRKPEKRDEEIHQIPLPNHAVELLESLSSSGENNPDSFVFPSSQVKNKSISEAAISNAISRMGFVMTGHGLRGLVSTALNELEHDSNIVDVQLGHCKKSSVEAAYNKARYFDKRSVMMQEWAKYLDKFR